VKSRFLRGTRNRSMVFGQGADVCCLLWGGGGGRVASRDGLVEEGWRIGEERREEGCTIF